jgi:hypothetical protein
LSLVSRGEFRKLPFETSTFFLKCKENLMQISPSAAIERAQNLRQNKIIHELMDKDTTVMFEDPLENDMVLNMGPQHPATHGVLRVLLRLDGETIIKCVPELGYLHRGYEKIAENMTYHEFIPHTDRLDYMAPMSNNVAITLAIENALGIEAPERAQWIRTLVSELATSILAPDGNGRDQYGRRRADALLVDIYRT